MILYFISHSCLSVSQPVCLSKQNTGLLRAKSSSCSSLLVVVDQSHRDSRLDDQPCESYLLQEVDLISTLLLNRRRLMRRVVGVSDWPGLACESIAIYLFYLQLMINPFLSSLVLSLCRFNQPSIQLFPFSFPQQVLAHACNNNKEQIYVLCVLRHIHTRHSHNVASRLQVLSKQAIVLLNVCID